MKKWLFFGAGVLTGVVLTFLLAAIFAPNSDDTPGTKSINTSDGLGMTLFENPGDTIEVNEFQVFQVITDNAALVNGKTEEGYDLFLGPVFLLTNKDGKYYYDEEIVKVPTGKVARQVGVWRYPTKDDMYKTVPIIRIMDK